MEFQAGDAVAQIDERGARVLPDDPVGRPEVRHASDALGDRHGLIFAGNGVEALPSAVAIPTGARGQKPLDAGADIFARGLHPVRGCAHAGRIPQLERPHLPVEAGAHGAIDIRGIVSHLRQAVRGVVPERGQQAPVEARRLVFRGIGGKQPGHALRQPFHLFRHFHVRQLGPRRGAVLQALPIQGQADFVACAVLLLPVKTLARFVAQPAPFEHGPDERRNGRVRPRAREVIRHVRQHVEPYQVRQAKRAHARPTDHRAGQRVHLFDREAFVLHEADRFQHGENADPVGDEVRRVAREHHVLAQPQVDEAREAFHRSGVGLRCRDDLHQPHVARRIEEVRAEPAAAEVFRHVRGDRGNRQAASVGGHQSPWLQMRRDLLEQRLLDRQVFRHRLDHPIAVGQQFEVVVEIAGCDVNRKRRIEERGRLAALQVLERLRGDAGGGAVLRCDVQHHHGQSRVGEMRSDARAHRSRAQHRRLADRDGRHPRGRESGRGRTRRTLSYHRRGS